MGFFVGTRQCGEGWSVEVQLRLSRAETTDLFFAGDSMVNWPEQGLFLEPGRPFERTGMFVSEISAKPGGLYLKYQTEDQATRVAAGIVRQLEMAGLRSEARQPEARQPGARQPEARGPGVLQPDKTESGRQTR
jgi:hypothetical protein